MRQNNIISRQQAARTGLQAVGGGRVVDIDFGKWGNIWTYKVEVRRNNLKYKVYINARTGRILRIKQDTDTFDNFNTLDT